MKLIVEPILTESIQYLSEGEDKAKTYFIEGVFMQAGIKNRNGRIYPSEILENEVNRYNETHVKQNRAVGELNHPNSPTVSFDRVSHLITNLRKEGNDFIGKAKILSDLPMGKIAEGLIKSGVKIGVSSRGLGSVKQNKEGIMEVQKDFHLATVDIVADPSAPSAFVNGILEGVEYIFDATKGTYLEAQIDTIQKDLKENHKKLNDNDRLRLMENFLKGLSRI